MQLSFLNQFSWLSFVLGVVVGMGLGLVLPWAWRFVRARLNTVTPLTRTPSMLVPKTSGRQDRVRSEIAKYVQQFHLGRRWAKLEDIFVSPRLLPPLPQDNLHKSAEWGIEQLNYIWPELSRVMAPPTLPGLTVEQLLLGARRVAISGGDGTGKTTLLAYCAHRYATATAEADTEALLGILPVFVHLAELMLIVDDPVVPLIHALQQQVSERTGARLDDLFRSRLKAGNLVLLLDGWDEVRSTEQEDVVQWLQDLLEQYPEVRIIISVGPTHYGSLLALEFFVVTLLPWHQRDCKQFVTQWTAVLPDEQNRLADFSYRRGQSALSYSLHLWLTAMSSGLETTSGMRRDTDLLAAGLTTCFGRSVEKTTRLDAQLVAFWQCLAYEMVIGGKLTLSATESMDLARQSLPASWFVSTENEAEPDLSASIFDSNLFVMLADGSVRFLCPTWRHYLAAGYMAQHNLYDVAEQHLQDANWAEVLRFYVGQTDGTRLASHLLTVDNPGLTYDALFQLASWVRETPHDEGEWRQQVLILLGQMARKRTYARILRQRSVAALAETREQGTFTFLKQLLVRSDPMLRQAGTAALPYLANGRVDEVAALLETMLSDGNNLVRRTAVHSLIWLGQEVSEKLLVTILLNKDEEMGQAVAEGLALAGGEGIEILREAVEDEASYVRQAAVRGLALLDDDWVIPLLQDIERNDEWSVRSVASAAVALVRSRKGGGPLRTQLPSELPWLVEYATQQGEYIPSGTNAISYLARILAKSSEPLIRTASAIALGQMVSDAAKNVGEDIVPILTAVTEESDPQVRNAAFTSLCLIQRAYQI